LVRGQEALPAFDVAPDFESYEFTKLDPKSEKDKAFVDDMWAWDKPIEVKGKKYEWWVVSKSHTVISNTNMRTGLTARSSSRRLYCIWNEVRNLR
jgi:hypothetical protein